MMGARGIVYDALIGEDEWDMDFEMKPYKDTDYDAEFQVFISNKSIDSLMGSYLEVGDLAGWVHGDQLPEKVNTTLTASMLDVAFPGFSAKYGADAIVDVLGNCTALHNFTSSLKDQTVSVYGTANLQFWPRVNGASELAVEINMIDVLFTGGIAIHDFKATAMITKFLVDKIEVVSSTVGDISALKLKVEINSVSKLLVPSLNQWVSKYPVPIPQTIGGIFTL